MVELTFLEAALKVLQEAGGGPLHYREITRRALENGWLQSSGLTPAATLGATLYSHIKQAGSRGEVPRVRSIGKGLFSLPPKGQGQIEGIVDQNNRDIQQRMLQHLHNMDPS